MARCRDCGEPIRWAKTERGRSLPLDPDPYVGDQPDGLFVLRHQPAGLQGWATVAVATTPLAFPGEPVYTSHLDTCAKRHG